ncbi:MAG: hypothetical protein WAW80_05290 [Candidatus Saccharimonadales bacterium]
MDNAKKQIVDIIKNNTNVLVTVSTNPTVDELSAVLGLTILLDDMDKRATAVFSGEIPPAITFLEPDKTFENTADSLRDFIIALDKEKADHLRYKVEGDVVKIFITPYKTELSQSDLNFSQGDYNVEVVLAVGVKDQDHLDKALEAHGKILHDATVITITAGNDTSNLGSVDWHDPDASSLSEMVVSLIDGLKEDKPLLNEQISTALLTGIVSATERFSNNHTSSRAMTIAAQLMAAGANQQLIAAKLEEGHDIAPGRVVDAVVNTVVDEVKPEEPSTELTIDRSGKNQKAEQELDLVHEPQSDVGLNFEITGNNNEIHSEQERSNDVVAIEAPIADEVNRINFEQQLESINVPSTGTMADIEKGLNESIGHSLVGDNVTVPETEAQTVESIQSGTPQFQSLGTSLVPTPEIPPVTELPAPQIINEHGGAFISAPLVEKNPINSIQNNHNDGETIVDPFNTGVGPQMPPLPLLGPETNTGTSEGAAILAQVPDRVSVPVDATVGGIPELPPLPSLPVGIEGQIPLPPPPPFPTFASPSLVNTTGAVSGDVFGDNSNIPATQPAPAPTEPGQFKIPGSA